MIVDLSEAGMGQRMYWHMPLSVARHGHKGRARRSSSLRGAWYLLAIHALLRLRHLGRLEEIEVLCGGIVIWHTQDELAERK